MIFFTLCRDSDSLTLVQGRVHHIDKHEEDHKQPERDQTPVPAHASQYCILLGQIIAINIEDICLRELDLVHQDMLEDRGIGRIDAVLTFHHPNMLGKLLNFDFPRMRLLLNTPHNWQFAV